MALLVALVVFLFGLLAPATAPAMDLRTDAGIAAAHDAGASIVLRNSGGLVILLFPETHTWLVAIEKGTYCTMADIDAGSIRLTISDDRERTIGRLRGQHGGEGHENPKIHGVLTIRKTGVYAFRGETVGSFSLSMTVGKYLC